MQSSNGSGAPPTCSSNPGLSSSGSEGKGARRRASSLQPYKQEHEDRPDSHGQRELNHRGVAHRPSPGEGKRQQHHCECGQHSNQESAFDVHVVDLGSFVRPGGGSRSRQAAIVHPNGVLDATFPKRPAWIELVIRLNPTVPLPAGDWPGFHPRKAQSSVRRTARAIPSARADGGERAEKSGRSVPRRRRCQNSARHGKQ
jgi:hypothetical protein